MQRPSADDTVLWGGVFETSLPASAHLVDDLMQAAAHGDINWVRDLLSKGATVNAITKDGKTPLAIACSKGHHAIAVAFLEHGANCDTQDQEGMTALHNAAQKGHSSLIELLLHNKAKVNRTCQLGRTPLHLAASCANHEPVRLLLRAGAHSNGKDELGWTPLHHAAWKGSLGVAELLLASGADCNVADKLGRLPEDLARTEEVRILLAQAKEHRHDHRWQRVAAQVVAGEICNLLLGRLVGGGPLATPQGKFYLGWVVRQADWLRTQGAPVVLHTPQLPISCLDAAKRLPWLRPADVMQRISVHQYMADRAFQQGVEVYDEQMKGLGQLVALPAAPLTWEALRSGHWLPARVKAPPALWKAPARLLSVSVVLRWVLWQAVKRGAGHAALAAVLLSWQHLPAHLVADVNGALTHHAKVVVVTGRQLVDRVHSKLQRKGPQGPHDGPPPAAPAEAGSGDSPKIASYAEWLTGTPR